MLELTLLAVFVVVLITLYFLINKTSLTNIIPDGDKIFAKGANPDDAIERANDFYERGQLTKAIKILEAYLIQNPNKYKVRLFLGDYLYEKNLPVNAIKQYQEALRYDPNNKITVEKIGDCFYLNGELNKALEHYILILKNSPDIIEIRKKVGEIYASLGKYDLATNEYLKVLAKDPFNIEIKNDLGDIYYTSGEYKNAIKEYAEVIRITGPKTDTFRKIAKAYSKLNNISEAALYYKKIMEQDEDADYAYKELAEIYAKSKNFDKAAQIYSTMLDKDIDVQPKNIIKLANLYILAEKYEEAMSICRKLLAEDPESYPAMEIIAQSLKFLKQYEQSLDYYKNLISENITQKKREEYKNNISSILCEWGNNFYANNEYQCAIDKYVEAIEFNPRNPEIYLNLGLVNQSIRNYEIAISYFNKALEFSGADITILIKIAQAYEEADQINSAVDLYYDAVKKYPDNCPLREVLGTILLKAGFYIQSEVELLKAIKLNSKNPEVYYNLGLTCYKQGRHLEAQEYYEKTLEIDPCHIKAQQELNSISDRK